MKEIKIILTNKGFEKSYLHYEIDFNEYYLFVNTKKYNRNLKKLIRRTKKIIYREENVSKDTKLIFTPIKYQKAVMCYETI